MLAPRQSRGGVPARASAFHMTAPTGGLNTVSAGLAMPPSDCVLAVNLISAENGLRTRLGWREFATGLTGADDNTVRTVMPFTGSQVGNSRLFVATSSGIFDVSASPTDPGVAIAFSSTSGDAGYGTSVAMVTSAGHFLVYCDEVNGMYVYTESNDTWTRPTMGSGGTQISGVNPSTLVFCAVFKGRLWFAAADSATAWYLPGGQVYGAATAFPLGAVFREGGSLVGLWNWTYDGGSGMDDSLVAVSTGGDVLVYGGTDPASASTFALRGVWQIGAPPTSRRIASKYGGDLLLLSCQGLVPLSKLVVGGAGQVEYATAKIANLVNRLMSERSTLYNWGVLQQPDDNALLVLVPTASDGVHTQLAQSVASRGWFLYRDVPMHAAAAWVKKLYFGTTDGRVCVQDGYVDDQPLADSTYEPIHWSLLSAFSTFGTPVQKQVQLLRPQLLSESGSPSFSVAARYNYDQTAIDPVELVLGGENTWDATNWDEGEWGGGAFSTSTARGATGLGVNVAVAISGTSIERTVLVGIDVTYTTGGLL